MSVAIVLWLLPAPSHAADITNNIFASVDPVNSQATLIQAIIDISGEIEQGDDRKIEEKFIGAIQKRNAFIQTNNINMFTKQNIFYVSSGGGEVDAAFAMVKVMKQIEGSGPTMIAVKGICASACAILLFSMDARFARLCDRIGVHRAAMAGVEGEETFSASTQIADYLMKNGVPWAVVKKMLLTSASNISWLTLEDMRLAHLSVLPGSC